VTPTCPLTVSKLAWGPKLQLKVNLKGLERVVFLGGQNYNFRKLRRSKM